MLNNIINSLIQLLVVGPFEAEINDRLARARAPTAIIAQVKDRTSAALPNLARRTNDDPRVVCSYRTDSNYASNAVNLLRQNLRESPILRLNYASTLQVFCGVPKSHAAISQSRAATGTKVWLLAAPSVA